MFTNILILSFIFIGVIYAFYCILLKKRTGKLLLRYFQKLESEDENITVKNIQYQGYKTRDFEKCFVVTVRMDCTIDGKLENDMIVTYEVTASELFDFQIDDKYRKRIRKLELKNRRNL
ncbi:hypothetical protein G6K79_002946 [Listeria monocytogenes]|uniref:hypothetical protein n=1 Tax=Listeria TaxID=1637 RepID=UPI000775796B|nr:MULTISPECIES: hypothetical protein [Listeria]EAD2626088.1 hypothetical protein [Listeria monocytogenes]EAF4053887.1 hypothetical protein [Listeria monocytogenes]EEO2021056.1 hypothetical protein [Listeria monocytogenes]EEO6479836.1 hypothetical protein [Listeria monocytogenes]EJS5893741.1 hypothetical protein [Listeria monocytogenes]